MERIRKLLKLTSSRMRRWASGFRLLPALLQVTVLLALLVYTLGPYMRLSGRSWWSVTSLRQAFVEGLPIIACALYLRYEEKFRKLFNQRKLNHRWKVRMAELARILDCLAFPDLRRVADVVTFRREILRCVVSGVSEILELPVESLTATLIILVGRDCSEMEVATRSDGIRDLGVLYESVDAYLPWRAIRNRKIEVDHDYREREATGPRPYRSIIAAPVTRGRQAFASLSIDSTSAFAFYGNEERVAFQIRPYLSLLSLTFGPMSPYHEHPLATALR